MSDRPEGLSVVVPTANRPAAVVRCVAALQACADPGVAVEVVVVDDGGQPEVDPAALAGGAYPVRVIRQENAGPAAARNRGAREARYRWLAMTDDDCRPRIDWLRAMAGALAEQPAALVGGRTVNALPHDRPAEASQLLNDYLYRRQLGIDPSAMFFASNNIALSAEGFAAVGGFDPAYRRAAGEDRALCRDWVASGRVTRYLAAAVVDHEHAMGWRKFWRQQCNYGRGAYTFARQAREAAGGEPRGEAENGGGASLGFYTGLVTYPLRARRLPGSLALTVLTGLSQLAITAGYLAELREARRGGAMSGVADRGERFADG